MSKDYYKILGVDKSASPEDVKKSFKKMAMQHHPDRAGGNEAKFKEINEAYQVLSDTDKRQKYDQYGSDFEQQGGFGGGMNWEDFMRAARGQGGQGGPGGGNFSFDFGGGDLGNMFGDLFGFGGGGRGGRGGSERGRDIQVDVELDFKEAAFGIEREISLRKQAACDVCSGSGAEPGSKTETCSTCHGQGQVAQNQRTFLGTVQTVTTCAVCHGRGSKPVKKCQHCNGLGVLQKNATVKVKIPAGIDNGQSIRVSGLGEAVGHGGTSGDLFVAVHIRQSSTFSRQGFDVYTEKQINFPEASLGAEVEVETMAGKLKIVIPAGTESGQLIRLKGKGIQQLQAHGHGDHYVKIKIVVPRKVSKKARQLLEELAKEL